jgi:hypothetical protein
MVLTVTERYPTANNDAAEASVSVADADRAMTAAVNSERRADGSPDTATDAFVDPDDAMNLACGLVNGTLLAVPLWGVIGLLVWSFLA